MISSSIHAQLLTSNECHRVGERMANAGVPVQRSNRAPSPYPHHIPQKSLNRLMCLLRSCPLVQPAEAPRAFLSKSVKICVSSTGTSLTGAFSPSLFWWQPQTPTLRNLHCCSPLKSLRPLSVLIGAVEIRTICYFQSVRQVHSNINSSPPPVSVDKPRRLRPLLRRQVERSGARTHQNLPQHSRAKLGRREVSTRPLRQRRQRTERSPALGS